MASFKGFGKNSGPAVPPKYQTPFGYSSLPNSQLQPSHPSPSDSSVSFNNHGQLASPGRHSASLSFLSNQSTMDSYLPTHDTQRNNLFLDEWGNQSKSNKNSNSSNRRSRSPVETADIPASKQSRSQFTDEAVLKSSHVHQQVSERHSLSPPRLKARKNFPRSPDVPSLNLAVYGMNSGNDADRPADHGLTKRTRSPPSPANQSIQENFYATLDGTERELQAKAKRLVRFKAELSDPVEHSSSFANQNVTSIRSDKFVPMKQKHMIDYSAGSTRDSGDDMDNEGGESTNLIVGLCPDMCPELERTERERKGDLDQYERLDGDRNQTSEALAVKKYNRTAEREANLIRPLPILQKTMGYLLNLLDQQYNESFLGLYNFLWDRMRAVRMDLRMQHIFNFEAITMLEQMIRLHIIAMHELCEYTKGEGFSEGFDPHLNIEQMNKTSVELFQLYDDHRKKGVYVPTEEEFRGYYALLKLDKHPGYKVEPAELSLDLAKMTPEMRQTKEVLFVREVARSCRTGNFIAFFRLARKATYLQACLMHAHFSKLRTQALASLHSGLQNNQGIPVAHVAKWLGMEGEDVESLLEYHGFPIKEFEEPYMVKESPFLNSDQDYPTQCSKLVHLKKSEMIAEDVLSSGHVPTQPAIVKKLGAAQLNEKTFQSGATGKTLVAMDNEMTESQVSSPRDLIRPIPKIVQRGRVDSPRASASSPRGPRVGQVQPAFTISTNHQQAWVDSPQALASSPRGIRQGQPAFTMPNNYLHGRLDSPRTLSSFSKSTRSAKPAFTVSNNHLQLEDGLHPTSNSVLPSNSSLPKSVPVTQQTILDREIREASSVLAGTSPKNDHLSRIKVAASQFKPGIVEIERPNGLYDSSMKSSLHDDLVVEEFGDEGPTAVPVGDDEVVSASFDEEVAEAKLKLFLRLWIRRYLRRKELREQNKVASASALASLSLGPQIRQNIKIPISYGKFNIDQITRTRYEKHEQSWSRVNVSDIVADKLIEINAGAGCICWKVVLWSEPHHRGNERELRNQAASLSGFEWLRSKLMPTGENDGSLLVSSPGLAIWRKWISNPAGNATCCLSVVKDAMFGDSSENLLGACGLLFPLSDDIPWEAEKLQLHNLVAALPPESHLPLLIINSLNEQGSANPSSTVFDKLGINSIDRSRIANFQLISLQVDGYFSDQLLREGLEWLATNSPAQPALYQVKTRDLVQTFLNSSFDALERMGSPVMGPEKCISLFNEALDQSMEDVSSAAKGSIHGWPCPELSFLDKTSEEHGAIKFFLPAVGWSSAERVQHLITGLMHCKLPTFSDDISWLGRGSNVGEGIADHKLSLRGCLVRYLTTSSKLMNTTLAAKEAETMVQNYTRLELHGVGYFLVPFWVGIFRRVFNWRLNMLASGASSRAYVLEKRDPAPGPLILNNPCSPRCYDHPSLDEMIEASCSPIVSERERPEPKGIQPIIPIMMSNWDVVGSSQRRTCNDAAVTTGEGRCCSHENQSVMEVDVDSCDKFAQGGEILPMLRASREADRLRKLLEQCSILQDKIDEKLRIYI